MASIYEPIEYDIGEVRELFDSCIIIGTITNVNHDDNEASVTTDKWGAIAGIPIHYHCPDEETVDKGHLAFEEDDGVYILHDGRSFPPDASTMKIVGFFELPLQFCYECDWDAVIGYTTLQMQADQHQTLWVILSEAPKVSWDRYTWEVSEGGGSIVPTKGEFVVYRAPSENEDCEQNPTIILKCDGIFLDEIKIAVNEYTGNELAYFSHCCQDGSYAVIGCATCHGTAQPCGGICAYACCRETYFPCIGDLPRCCLISIGTCGDFPVDRRSAEMIKAGCCPEALL